jgi:hypothetical protein
LVASYSGDGRGCWMARLTWLSFPGSWSGRGRSHTASYPSNPRIESAAAPCAGPARPTAEGASAFRSKRQAAGQLQQGNRNLLRRTCAPGNLR